MNVELLLTLLKRFAAILGFLCLTVAVSGGIATVLVYLLQWALGETGVTLGILGGVLISIALLAAAMTTHMDS